MRIPEERVCEKGPKKPRVANRSPDPYIYRIPVAQLQGMIEAGAPKGLARTVCCLLFVTSVENRETFSVGPQMRSMFGLTRTTFYRWLVKLEAAGKVRCDRQRGRWPIVTLL